MNTRETLRFAIGAALMIGLHLTASAGLLLGGTRVIFGEKAREASISVKNTGANPYVVQAWIEAGESKGKTPFLVTPPLSRLEAGQENILRILRVPSALPTDRESVLWLNVKEIPEKVSELDVLQVAVRSRIKLFYRPAGLPGNPLEVWEQLQWAVGQDGQGGAVLKVGNPTPYHASLTTLKINGTQQEINADMVPPFDELVYPLTAVGSPQEVQVSFSLINDYGGETPRRIVRVPVADKPMAVKSEPAPR